MSMALHADTPARPVIAPETSMGVVSLTVSDMARSSAFYERAIGLRPFEQEDGSVAFGPSAEQPLVRLYADSSASRLDRRRTGLYHLAILVPSRVDLALSLARLITVGWPLDGASDHLVSEALYLSDPDGNGIEIYRDRPREEWRHSGDQLEMATLPLDLQDVMNELAEDQDFQAQAPESTKIGHVHLQVADLEETEAFYSGVLGFDVMVRGYPGALFVSAGGYHHHLGLNTWHTAGASAPAPGAVGLRSFEVVVPEAADLEHVVGRIRAAGLEASDRDGVTLVRDPSGNAVLLRSATS
jgi:catechol 2,3-dioxygenase